MHEIGGLRFDDIPVIRQPKLELPTYVPLIHHGYSRPNTLRWPVVALNTYSLFHSVGGRYQTIAQSADELRRMFSLDADTQIILRGVSKDPPLERYWSHQTTDRPAEQLARLGIACAVGPNFSHFLDVPRTDNLFNRKRQLICLAGFSGAGLGHLIHGLNCVNGLLQGAVADKPQWLWLRVLRLVRNSPVKKVAHGSLQLDIWSPGHWGRI